MTAVILLCLASFGVNAAESQTAEASADGMVAGMITITRSLSAQRMRFRLYPSYKPVPPPPEGAGRDDEYQNVVIYIEPLDREPPDRPPPPDLKILQLGETFIPHVLPVTVGSTVEFPNLDPIFHNVFSLSSTKTFDLGRYPKGETRSVTFDKAGVVPVFCHLHSDMSAVVVVLETPLFTIPQPDGRYQITRVPQGRYRLVAWHERSAPVETTITVGAGERVEVNVTVPIEDEEDPGN